MNRERTTTRKRFLRWSGLAMVGGFIFGRKTMRNSIRDLTDGQVSAPSLPSMSRICPDRKAVARKRA